MVTGPYSLLFFLILGIFDDFPVSKSIKIVDFEQKSKDDLCYFLNFRYFWLKIILHKVYVFLRAKKQMRIWRRNWSGACTGDFLHFFYTLAIFEKKIFLAVSQNQKKNLVSLWRTKEFQKHAKQSSFSNLSSLCTRNIVRGLNDMDYVQTYKSKTFLRFNSIYIVCLQAFTCGLIMITWSILTICL